MKKKFKKLPIFKNEDEEFNFWATHDSTDYIDWSKAKRVVFPNLKPTLQTISLRMPKDMIDSLKNLANKRDIPYQSLMKNIIAEKLREEALPYRAGRKK